MTPSDANILSMDPVEPAVKEAPENPPSLVEDTPITNSSTPEPPSSSKGEDSTAENAAEVADGTASDSCTSGNATSETGNDDAAAASPTASGKAGGSRKSRNNSEGAQGKARKLEALLAKILGIVTQEGESSKAEETKTKLITLITQCQTLTKDLPTELSKRKRRTAGTRKNKKPVKREGSTPKASETTAQQSTSATPQETEDTKLSRSAPKAAPIRGRVLMNSYRAQVLRQPLYAPRTAFYNEALEFNALYANRVGPFGMRPREANNFAFMDLTRASDFTSQDLRLRPMRRPRERRDQMLQEKEQANVRSELRKAETAADFQKAIERAVRLGMDYEVASATRRLEKILTREKAAAAPV